MWQRNEIELFSGPLNAKTAANNLIKLSGRKELRDRQFPDRMTSRGCRISSSPFNHDEQFSISCGLGTRSLPPGAFPGKQRQTAAK
jgi:hypothetical protein